jgi:hypothetical protein
MGTLPQAPVAPSAEAAALEEEICTHLVAAIEAAPLTREPFPFISLRGCFRDTLYQELLANLPGDDFYEPLLHKDSVRSDSTSRASRARSPRTGSISCPRVGCAICGRP